MATNKNLRIAHACAGPISGDTLQTRLGDGFSTTAAIAAEMGVSTAFLTGLLALVEPLPLMPYNWTDVNRGPYPFPAPWQGVAPIAYSGPYLPGFTYGAPVNQPAR